MPENLLARSQRTPCLAIADTCASGGDSDGAHLVRTLKMTLAYDGTDYAGWQRQLDRPTVQAELERALESVTGEQITTVASGRTDAGVHALAQVVSLRTTSSLAAEVLQRAVDSELPRDITVLEVSEAVADFHAIRDAARKRYRYVVHDGATRDVFRLRYAWHVNRRLDTEAMRCAAAHLVGTHDFRSFESQWPNRTSSVRTVFELVVTRGEATSCDLITIEIEADGFLYNMVRAIVGTLVEVGRQARSSEWTGEVLRAMDRSAAGPTAPPQGLFLVQVVYDG